MNESSIYDRNNAEINVRLFVESLFSSGKKINYILSDFLIYLILWGAPFNPGVFSLDTLDFRPFLTNCCVVGIIIPI